MVKNLRCQERKLENSAFNNENDSDKSKVYYTRSCAALRAADLDWIVGPEYSLGF